MDYRSALTATALLAALMLSACERNEGVVERAVEGTQDALDVREHEKLKDAGEDAADAMDNAAEGIRDEAQGR